MRSAIALATLLAGCQLVFPLDEQTVETGVVHGTLVTKTAIHRPGASFEVVTGTGEDATLIATVGGEDVAVPVVDGEFTFERSAKEYRLAVSFGGEILELQDDAAELSLLFSFAGRDGAPAVTQTTQLTLPAPVVGTVAAVATIGQWSATFAPTSTFDWKSATPNGNKKLGLLSGADGDRLYYLRYTPDAFGNGATAITDHFVVDDLMMTNGTAVPLMDQTLTHETVENRCFSLVAHQESNVERLLDVLTDVPEPGYDPVQRDWQVLSVPSLETGGTGAVGLASAAPASLDLEVDGKFFDPFDAPALAFVEVTDARQVKFSEASVAAKVPASIGFLDIIPPGNNCAAETVTFADTVALAGEIELDHTPLTTEHQVIALARPSDALLTWVPDNTRVDAFDVLLLEVVAVGNETGIVLRRHFRTRTPRLVIPADLLAPGHQYLLQIVSQVAFPKISEGDYATFAYPVMTGTVYSSVFGAM